uniref:Flavoprotein pyridine nucleotide cytochrome reductase-like FAD-binding domain-containing protein n=1 Tax=Gossypium raimondii TaxID=29730 RepID=A0A0D2VZ88_GOSRA|nr:hypothetical protein B456_012G138400 [Gossypium raimondii]
MYPQGRMSHHFRELRVGDYLAVKGPKGRFRYQPGEVRAFGMIAGGSGITPMLQGRRLLTRATIGLIIAGGAYVSTVDEATFWRSLLTTMLP